MGETLLDRTDLVNVHLRILVVEDDHADFLFIQRLLGKSRFLSADLLWARGLQEALPIISAGNLDLILSDLNLRELQGVDTITCLNEAAKKVPIVVMTGLDDERVALQILRAGAQDYLVKGKFDTPELVRAIRYSIERKIMVVKLHNALEDVKTLSGLLPICASCKKIRNDQGYWKGVEDYISEHADVRFSHGLCPGCIGKYFDDVE